MEAPTPVCPACGWSKPGARFCGACGAPLSVTAAQQIVQPPPAGGGLGVALGCYFAALAGPLGVAVSGAGLGGVRVAGLALLGLGVLAVLATLRASLPTLVLPRASARGAALAAGAVAAILAAVQLLAAAAPALFRDELGAYREAGLGLADAMVDAVVLAPLAEEALFRVVILTALVNAMGERSAVVVSALLFATIHVSPLSFPHLAALGWVLARVRLASGSVWPCVLLHGAYNGALLLLEA